MFTPSMTNEEIEAVAYKDFLEIRGRVEIAKDKFVQRGDAHPRDFGPCIPCRRHIPFKPAPRIHGLYISIICTRHRPVP